MKRDSLYITLTGKESPSDSIQNDYIENPSVHAIQISNARTPSVLSSPQQPTNVSIAQISQTIVDSPQLQPEVQEQGTPLSPSVKEAQDASCSVSMKSSARQLQYEIARDNRLMSKQKYTARQPVYMSPR